MASRQHQHHQRLLGSAKRIPRRAGGTRSPPSSSESLSASLSPMPRAASRRRRSAGVSPASPWAAVLPLRSPCWLRTARRRRLSTGVSRWSSCSLFGSGDGEGRVSLTAGRPRVLDSSEGFERSLLSARVSTICGTLGRVVGGTNLGLRLATSLIGREAVDCSATSLRVLVSSFCTSLIKSSLFMRRPTPPMVKRILWSSSVLSVFLPGAVPVMRRTAVHLGRTGAGSSSPALPSSAAA